jgi:hypothetical protein
MTRLSVLLFFLLASLGLSCAAGGPTTFGYINAPQGASQTPPKRIIPIWVDDSFGDADDVSIQAALDQWTYALNGYIQFDVRSYHFQMQDSVLTHIQHADGWVFLKVDSNNKFINYQDRVYGHPGNLILACTDKIGGNTLYIIRDRMINSQVSDITMHEIGHLLGADHQNGGLMDPAPNENNARCIDLGTLKQVAAYQHLDYHLMNYCVYSLEPLRLQEGQ